MRYVINSTGFIQLVAFDGYVLFAYDHESNTLIELYDETEDCTIWSVRHIYQNEDAFHDFICGNISYRTYIINTNAYQYIKDIGDFDLYYDYVPIEDIELPSLQSDVISICDRESLKEIYRLRGYKF